jgi:hypothetical protein
MIEKCSDKAVDSKNAMIKTRTTASHNALFDEQIIKFVRQWLTSMLDNGLQINKMSGNLCVRDAVALVFINDNKCNSLILY